MATVKPISAIMPSTAEPPTAHSTPRGTLLRGVHRVLGHVGGQLEPDQGERAEQPGQREGVPRRVVEDATSVLVRMPAPYGVGLAWTPHSTSSSTPNTTVPMISVNTATLLTRAATWMLMMLMTTGSSIRMIATASTRRGLGVVTLNSLSSSGAATGA